jgi:hypothetical protein
MIFLGFVFLLENELHRGRISNSPKRSPFEQVRYHIESICIYAPNQSPESITVHWTTFDPLIEYKGSELSITLQYQVMR